MVLKGNSAAGSEDFNGERVLISVIKEGVVLSVNTAVPAIARWESLLFLCIYFPHGSVNFIAGQMKEIKNYEVGLRHVKN